MRTRHAALAGSALVAALALVQIAAVVGHTVGPGDQTAAGYQQSSAEGKIAGDPAQSR